jgi:hypothetical protein|nr:MAG TPA: hypothetical protein [Caudoviricetes sp.]
MAEIENVVIIDRFDYDELVKKAKMTDDEIKKQAEHIFIEENAIPVRIEFIQYLNTKNFTAPIGFIRGMEKDDVYRALNDIEPKIKDWMNENLRLYTKSLRDKNITEKNCIGLSKRVINLEERLKLLKIKNTYLLSYAVIISMITIFLLCGI